MINKFVHFNDDFDEPFQKFVSTDKLHGKSHLCIPIKEIMRPQSQFQHSCVCERFINSHDRYTYFVV